MNQSKGKTNKHTSQLCFYFDMPKFSQQPERTEVNLYGCSITGLTEMNF